MAAVPPSFNGGGMGWLRVTLVALALAGCGTAMDSGDRFAPGKWKTEAWMESDQGSTRGQTGGSQTETVELSTEDAGNPPAAVFFSRFYHGVSDGDIRFSGGKVDGTFHQKRVDDVGEHDVAVSGTYGPDRFHVVFAYKAFGMTINQVVDGKLVEPAPRPEG
jgi:hypothetical protein